jgi:hypothetical protein
MASLPPTSRAPGNRVSATAKKGKNAPYILAQPDERDVANPTAAMKELGLL